VPCAQHAQNYLPPLTSPPSDHWTPSDSKEAACRDRLRAYLHRVGQSNPEKNLSELLGDHYTDQFNYFSPRLPATAFRKALISGCAVGSELIVARRFGMKEVVGVEVVPEYVSIARDRFSDLSGYDVVLYSGAKLPFPDGHFSFVTSAHVIEHTPWPFGYFRECLRVLEDGGCLFIEFPDRYHPIELHTGTPSVEYLPGLLRSLVLRWRESKMSGTAGKTKWLYREIRTTLKPISVWQLRFWLFRVARGKGRIVDWYHPAPGFTRVLLRK